MRNDVGNNLQIMITTVQVRLTRVRSRTFRFATASLGLATQDWTQNVENPTSLIYSSRIFHFIFEEPQR